jgi:Ca-activated chloride channel family protein
MKSFSVPAKMALSWIGFLVWVCLATLAFSRSTRAQSHDPVRLSSLNRPDATTTAPIIDAPTKSLRLDVDLVLVPVMVTDLMSRPVTGLEKENFALYEDHVQQGIRYFSTEDVPISVGLLLDLSKSMSNKFNTERAAVSEFFKNANAQDDYFVITFSDHPKLVTGSTQSIDIIQSNLALEIPDGNTALLDAISEGATRMRSAQYRRRALLIISDGGDNHSRHHLKEIKRLVQDSDLEVYAIGIFDTSPFKSVEESLGKRWLSEITEATGGRTIAVDSASKVLEAAAAISREMRDQYVLGYQPTNMLGERGRRKITVQVAPPVGVRTLHTYYKTGYVPSEEAAQPLYTK